MSFDLTNDGCLTATAIPGPSNKVPAALKSYKISKDQPWVYVLIITVSGKVECELNCGTIHPCQIPYRYSDEATATHEPTAFP